MPVPASINDLSTTASANSPAGSESPGIIDDIQRAHASFIATLRDQSAAQQTALNAKLDKAGGTLTGPLNEAKGADIASAATIDLSAATGNQVTITGTATITAVTLASGAERVAVFAGTPTLQHNAGLILPTGENITAELGDIAVFRGDGALVRVSYFRYNGKSLALLKASLAEVQAGTDDAKAVTPQTLRSELGAQAMMDVVASRSLGVTYTNTTGKPIFVNVSGIASDGSTYLQAVVASFTLYGGQVTNLASQRAAISFIVPSGATYSVSINAGSVSSLSWKEIR